MNAKNKAASPVQADHLGETASRNQDHITTPTPFPQASRLSPRKRRTITALEENPGGLLSYDLGRMVGAMNIADVVMHLRRTGFNISCELEPFTTQDGERSKVGRYRLHKRGAEVDNG